MFALSVALQNGSVITSDYALVLDARTNADALVIVDNNDVPLTATLADAMLDEPDARGIIICGTGAGVMIAANRYKHIRASRCNTPNQARDDRFHDDTNVLALAADDIDIEVAFLCVQAFLESPFDASERRIRRIQKIS